MKKHYLFLFMMFSFSNIIFSQIGILNEVPPIFDLQPLQENLITDSSVDAMTLTETLDHVFDSISTISPITGFNAAMQLPDGTLWKRASGLAEALPDTVSLTTDHLMAMGSISKTFVSATLLLLSEDGLLSLDDTIGQYLDAYPNVPANVTIRQLLSHRTGINDYLNENPATINAWGNNPDSIWAADTLLYHYVLEPNFAPGAAWSYSNTNYLLAGRIIENITGQAWYEVVRERIIDPMGLTHTFTYPWESPGNQPFSHAWLDLDGIGPLDDAQGSGLPLEGFFSMAGSAGCLITTPEDLVYFSDQLYAGGFLQAASLAEMQTDQVFGALGAFQYGLGAASFSFGPGVENWGHNGSLIYQSFALHFPQKEVSIAVQQNDFRLSAPGAPVVDIYSLMLGLFNACQNYTPPVTTTEPVVKNDLIKLSPNPSSGQIVIELQGELGLPINGELININGQLMRSFQFVEKRTNIYLEDLQEGMYFLSIGGQYEKVMLGK